MRSLPDLTEHLTARADDSHAAPVYQPRRETCFHRRSDIFQDQVRFFAELSHMLHRLCGPPSIPLSFSLAAVVPRRSTYRVGFDTERTKSPHIKLTTFTAWTTRVSNPVCSPCFRLSESVSVQQAAFALGVLPDIYAFHRYTWYSAYLSGTLVHQSTGQFRS